MIVVEAIAEILKREGVEYLNCYPTTPLIEALSTHYQKHGSYPTHLEELEGGRTGAGVELRVHLVKFQLEPDLTHRIVAGFGVSPPHRKLVLLRCTVVS